MKTIHVRYYADLPSITKTSVEDIQIPDSANLYDLLMTVFAKYAAFAEVELFLAMRNGLFVPVSEYKATALADGDEVGFLPPAQSG